MSCEILELQVSHAACNTSADSAAHLAVARPAQIEARQSPLKEGDAISVLHLAFRNFGRHFAAIPSNLGPPSVQADGSKDFVTSFPLRWRLEELDGSDELRE